MNGQEFYKLLREVYGSELHNFLKENNLNPDEELEDTQWTDLMIRVLEKVRTKARFDSVDFMKEVSVIRGKGKGKIDYKWQTSDETIFIEHENSPYSSPLPEIMNLLNSDGDLRILIVYTKIRPNSDSIKETVLQQLKKNISNRKFEFLLLIGRGYVNSPDNWEAVSYRLAFEPFPLTA
jgi:hypothetical protein